MKNQSRRSSVVTVLVVAAALLPMLLPLNTSAQVAPATVKLVVGYPSGGSVDTLARLLQAPLQQQLNATVIVDNKPGAVGRIVASQFKREPVDGSVIMIAPNALTTVQTLVYAGKIDYDVLKDFTPTARLVSYPFSLSVPASSPVRTLPDLVASMKANPGKAGYGTSGDLISEQAQQAHAVSQ